MSLMGAKTKASLHTHLWSKPVWMLKNVGKTIALPKDILLVGLKASFFSLRQ